MTSARPTSSGRALTLAAVLIALGASCLGVKAGAILLGDDQPPVLFEIAGLPLGLGLLLIALWSIDRHGRSPLLALAAALSLIAAVASAYQVLQELLSRSTPEPLESILAVSGGLLPVIAALAIGLGMRFFLGPQRVVGQRSLLLAVTFLPLMVLGGIAAGLAGERYLEIGLLLVAFVWLSLAHATATAGRGAGPDLRHSREGR